MALTMVVLAAMILAYLVWPGEKEPKYQGKKLSEWLEMYREHYLEAEAVEAVRIIGTNGIPSYLKWICYERSKWRVGLNDALDKVPVVNRLSNRISEVGDRGRYRTEAAVEGFQILGSEARVAVPELTVLMHKAERPSTCTSALYALCFLGEAGVAEVLAAFDDPNFHARRQALYALASTSQKTNLVVVIPHLIKCLGDRDEQLACESAAMLGHFAAQHQIVVPALVQCAQRTDLPKRGTTGYQAWSDRRHRCVIALGEFGPDANSAVPWLQELASDTNHYLYHTATNSLQKIGFRGSMQREDRSR